MVEIVKFDEQEDGSAIITIDLTADEVISFAKIGLLKTLLDVATEEGIPSYPTGYDPKDEIECRSNNPGKICSNCSCWKNQNE